MVTGDEGRLGNSYVCLCLQGTAKTLITLFATLKAYNFTNESQTTLCIIFCAHVACTCNILEDTPHKALKQDKPTCVRTWGLKKGEGI